MSFRKIFVKDDKPEVVKVAIDNSRNPLPSNKFSGVCEVCGGGKSEMLSHYPVRINGHEQRLLCCSNCIANYGVA